MSNAQFELPPLQKGLMCKMGELDMEGYGETKKGMCLDEDQHCFMAICNEHYKTVWGCTPVASKAFISAKIGDVDNAKVNCLFLFGRKGLDFSNENFTEQMMTTTTTKTSPKRKTKTATTTTTSTTTVTTIGMEKQTTNPEESQTTSADEVNSAICAKFAMLWVELIMLIIGVPAAVHLN
ncbi:hypothetical protein niasHT_026739 [Heterodera trifolii]|uniref:Uncharacterized protein n=1 Tax=Heterodera trifolii TaxID=157864 RepID=A0ABD2JNL6_9BILA